VRRVLTTFDATCIGVNAIVGSGIYLFPGRLSTALGPASVLAWIATGVLCLPLAFTYAALGAGEDRAGGSFRYTQRAFGTVPAFAVGWSAWITSVISWAAVASGLPGYLSPFLPGAASNVPAHLTSAGIIAAFTLLNVVGVKPGARLTDTLTLAKLVPLIAFIGIGLFAIEPKHFTSSPSASLSALPAMMLMTMFAYQGFEVIGIPAGELENPRRSVPRAVIGAMLGSALLYALVQLVFVGVGGGSTSLPLPDAARTFLGPAGATLLGAGGLISMLGFNAGTALCTPRYLEALAEERLVPPGLARLHARFQTPALAILTSGTLALLLSLVLDFDSLVDLAVLAVLVQYLSSSLSLVRLAKTKRQRLLGLASAAISIGFALECQPIEGVVLLILLAVGGAVALTTRRALSRERTLP
jgi:APA family basic amino acid/polyamine antiporter